MVENRRQIPKLARKTKETKFNRNSNYRGVEKEKEWASLEACPVTKKWKRDGYVDGTLEEAAGGILPGQQRNSCCRAVVPQ